MGNIVEVLARFPDLEFKIARGNCDVNEEVLSELRQLSNVECEEILQFEIVSKKFAIAHRVQDLQDIQNAEIYISGHTHIPQVKNIHGKLFLNPGSLMDDGGYFLLDLETLDVQRKLFNENI